MKPAPQRGADPAFGPLRTALPPTVMVPRRSICTAAAGGGCDIMRTLLRAGHAGPECGNGSEFLQGFLGGFRRLRHLGPVPHLLAPAETGAGDADRGAPGGLVRRVRSRLSAVAPWLRLAARRPGAPARAADAGCQQRPDQHQLGPVHLGGEQRPRGRIQPGLFHQPAVQCAARRADTARAAQHRAARGGGLCRRRRDLADLAARRTAVDRPGPGPVLRQLRPDPQDRRGGSDSRPGRGERVPVPARAGLSAVDPAPGSERVRPPAACTWTSCWLPVAP